MIGSLYQHPHPQSCSINDDQQPKVKEKKPSLLGFPELTLREKISEKISFLRNKTNEIGLSILHGINGAIVGGIIGIVVTIATGGTGAFIIPFSIILGALGGAIYGARREPLDADEEVVKFIVSGGLQESSIKDLLRAN